MANMFVGIDVCIGRRKATVRTPASTAGAQFKLTCLSPFLSDTRQRGTHSS
jgi:hypothetical protein